MANIVFGFQGGDEKKEEPKKKGWSALFGSLNKVAEQVSTGVSSLGIQTGNGTARKQLIEEVRGGNVESALRLYDMYMSGEGVEVNPMEAWFWARIAGDMGSAKGDYLTGVCFRDGIGVGRDVLKAFAYFERAGRRGSEEGNRAWNDIMREQVNFYTNARNLSWEELKQVVETDSNIVNRHQCAALMAQMEEDNIGKNWVALDYRAGRGTEQNYIAAVYWFHMAINAGNTYAFYNLANMYESGLGVLVDYDKAIELYSRAAECGHDGAKQRISILHQRKNIPVEKYADLGLSMESVSADGYTQYQMYHHFMLVGANLGNASCCSMVSNSFRSMHGVQRDYVEALYYLAKICLLDDSSWYGAAYRGIAIMYALGQGLPVDMDKAEFYYDEAKKYREQERKYADISSRLEAARSESKGDLFKEAKFLYEGYYCNPDTKKAIELYKQSARNQDIRACMKLAMLYEEGIAVPRDLNLAWEYIMQAETLGANPFVINCNKAGILLGQLNHKLYLKLDRLPIGNAFEEAEEAYSCGAREIAHGFIDFILQRGEEQEQGRAREILKNWEIEDRPSFLDEEGEILEDEITYVFNVPPFDDEAFAEIQHLKEAEDYEALYELGAAYANGEGREVNRRIATYCFRLCLDDGDERAWYALALGFMYGEGLPVNLELAEYIVKSLVDVPDFLPEFREECKDALEHHLPEARKLAENSLMNTSKILYAYADAHTEVYRPVEYWALYEYYYCADCMRRIENAVSMDEAISFSDYKMEWEYFLQNAWWNQEENEVEVTHLGNDTLPDNLDSYFDGLIGMETVKEQLNKIYQSVKMQLLRDEILSERGEEPQGNENGYNFILLGNPGTGKTTIARIIAKILYDIKVRTSDSFVEIERSGIVGEHIGATEKRMKEILEKVEGGTLFIDEAYALYREDSDNDFGQEAIDVLMKDMEDHRNSYSVIMAGYKEPMLNMIRHANSGFSSRFSYTIELPDYSDEALIAIAHMHIDKQKFVAEEGVDAAIKKCIAHDKLDNTFGNARYIRELVHRAIENQSHRLNEQGDYAQNEIFVLKPEDFWQDELEEKTIEYYMQQLEQLTGLADIKNEVKSLVNQITVQKELEKRGIVDVAETGTLHMAFKGNPGTGKTTVARLIGKIYASLGVLKRGDVFVECTRANLVGKYQGHTAANVKKIVETALGGVLFIDEAYSLVQGDGDSFGKEAVDTLVAEMENKRKNLVIIFAGYTKDLDAFLQNNAGLRSRVPKDLYFEDYNLEELDEIALQMLSAQKMTITEDAKQAIRMRLLKEKHTTDFGNARGVRNMVEDIKRKQNVRVAALLIEGAEAVSDEQLLTIEKEDVI